jgi:acetyl-CoA carboxylase biotin carboxylase subunit
MGECAILVAKAVDYVGAGTVEFLVSDLDKSFYFLEMNTRLQVEHPVTELVTDIDLVREQIRVAAGEKLSFTQDGITWNKHAIECRVYAEDPDNNFLPSPGKITRLQIPQGNGVRDDSGVYEGAEVSIYYDPMISKLAVVGRTREEAINRLRRALSEYKVDGIKTTLPFFREIIDDREFIEGKLDTSFITRFNERKKEREIDVVTRDLALIAAVLAAGYKQVSEMPGNSQKTPSRWTMAGRLAAHQNRF